MNAIVAIMPFKYNQEDSIIMNKASIERGFGRCTQLKTIKDTLCPDETYEELQRRRQSDLPAQLLAEVTHSLAGEAEALPLSFLRHPRGHDAAGA